MSVGGTGRNALVQARAGRQGVVLDEPAQVPSFVWPIAQVEPVIGFVVYGQPAPQGSKRIACRNGRPVVKEASDSLAPWRDSVRTVARQAIRAWSSRQGKSWEPLDCPVLVQAVLTMPATEASHRRGDVFPTGAPDVDKLERGVGDALSPVPVSPNEFRGVPPKRAARLRKELLESRRRESVLWDDSRIVSWDARKVFPSTTVDSLAWPGVMIRVWRAEDLLRWRP